MPCSASGLHVLGIVVAAEDAAVDLGMERLQPAVHHLGEAGVLGDVADGDALALQVLAGAAGAEDFHAGGGQAAGEVGQAELVADADQRTLDAGRFHGGYFRGRGASATPTLRVVAATWRIFIRANHHPSGFGEMSMPAGRISCRPRRLCRPSWRPWRAWRSWPASCGGRSRASVLGGALGFGLGFSWSACLALALLDAGEALVRLFLLLRLAVLAMQDRLACSISWRHCTSPVSVAR